jgi:hypothetical protein
MPLVTNSSNLAPNEVNANTKLYMQILSRNLIALLFLLVKRTSSSCSVTIKLDNRTLPFSQHIKNCGLLLLDFANHSLIHIFVLHNPQIVSISPQSHRVRANASLSLNNYNGLVDFIHCLAHRSLCRQLRPSRVDSNVFWLNFGGALIRGTWFSKVLVCSSFYWASSYC